MGRAKDVLYRWLAGEYVLARSRAVLLLWLAVSVASLAYCFLYAVDMTHALRTAQPPPPLPPDHDDVKFGVPLELRKRIFAELAAAEPHERAEGAQKFPGFDLEWSAEDHRGGLERKAVTNASNEHQLSLTQVYLILDEGIREHWLGPDGQPLSPRVVPLHPRRKYGW
ncbi:MAG TPA: hypothetical protein VIF62_33700 [Labilithrix sp.]|jgi:hypothetical protein